jgi:hypothetical protein
MFLNFDFSIIIFNLILNFHIKVNHYFLIFQAFLYYLIICLISKYINNSKLDINYLINYFVILILIIQFPTTLNLIRAQYHLLALINLLTLFHKLNNYWLKILYYHLFLNFILKLFKFFHVVRKFSCSIILFRFPYYL